MQRSTSFIRQPIANEQLFINMYINWLTDIIEYDDVSDKMPNSLIERVFNTNRRLCENNNVIHKEVKYGILL